VCRVAAIALSAFAIVAVAATAFAEDRGARVDDSPQADRAIQIADSGAARADDGLVAGAQSRSPAPGPCRERTLTTSVAEICQAGGRNTYSLKRSIDWSAVGPSTDDFAPDEDNLRLVGARLVGTFRF
jgi:hypothetical protein